MTFFRASANIWGNILKGGPLQHKVKGMGAIGKVCFVCGFQAGARMSGPNAILPAEDISVNFTNVRCLAGLEFLVCTSK